MRSRFEADCEDGEWYVFDNEICYCCAGPMSEHSATSKAIELNREHQIKPGDTGSI